MKFEDLLKDLWMFDFEVTQFDWLLVCINYTTNEEIIFHNDTPNKVYEFIQKNPILIGHNARYYDQYILKAILSGYSMSEIKALNDNIITGGQGFEFNFDFREPLAIWDTMQDIVPQKSLKEIEANLLLDITESTVSFDIDHLWTKEEYEEMLYYCRADVNALRPLFDARKGYFETKFDLCLLSNIEPRYNVGLTNAKLCAKFLEATKIDRTDERDYVIPKTIDTNYVDKRILEFFNKIYDDSISSEDLFSRKLEFEEHGMPSVVSWGGKHGALPNFIFEQEKEPDMILINADFESLYPHILALEEYNTISRNIKDKKKYYNTLQNRLKLKHEGKKKEQLALKLVLNTTYGCLLNQYNDLFDPRGARSTCINGQLLISELTERIYQIGDVQLVQVNTDGIMVKLPKSKLDTYYKVCDDFAKKVKINLEYDIIEKIIQKDVNNYILIMKDKDKYKIKAKGGYFSNLPNLSMDENKNIKSEYVPNFKTNTMAIVSEALARNLLLDTPIEETINNCNNVNMFQIVNHIGNTYKKLIQRLPTGDIELQHNNRIYNTKEPTGTIYKVKPNGREDSLANQPPNPIIDNKNELTIDRIDKRWYIKIAKQRVNDFRGVKRMEDYKKDELLKYCEEHNIPTDKKMKKSEILKIIENVNAEKEERNEKKMLNIYQKINELRKSVRKHKFIMDKELPSNLGSGEYASIGQYYDVIQDACIDFGLDFSWETTNIESFEKGLFKPQGKPEQHVWTVKCLATFTDIETGDKKEYTEIASGSDICDKGVSGASTLAFRNWFDKNFSPKNNDDETVGDEEPKTEAPKVPTYIPPQKKETIKEEVVNTPQKEESDETKAEEIAERIMKIRDLLGNDTYGASVINAITSGNYESADILEWNLKTQNKLDSLQPFEE